MSPRDNIAYSQNRFEEVIFLVRYLQNQLKIITNGKQRAKKARITRATRRTL